MTDARCPECGARGAATVEACAQRFNALGLERFDDSELATDWRLVVDCYAVQHDDYIRSARSLAAHLTGVCIALEHRGDEALLRAVQQWLGRTRDLHSAFRYADASEAGMLHVNLPTLGGEAHVPFGGVKDSGFGDRECGTAAFDFFTDLRVVYVGY